MVVILYFSFTSCIALDKRVYLVDFSELTYVLGTCTLKSASNH